MSEEAYNRIVTRDASMPMAASPRRDAPPTLTTLPAGQTGPSRVEVVHFTGIVSSVPATGVSHPHPGPGAPALLHFEQPVHFERHGPQQGPVLPVHRRSNSWGTSSWQVASLLP